MGVPAPYIKTAISMIADRMRKALRHGKAQSAMEFLSNYIWAILIIAIAVGVLFKMGVFSQISFAPKAPPGSCSVYRPQGPYTTYLLSLEGECHGELPQYVAQFDGQSSYVSIPSSSFIQLNGAFTLSFWLKVNSVSGGNYDGAFSEGYSGPGGSGWIVFYACTALCGPLYKRANVQYSWNLAPTIGQWKQYVMTYDGNGNLYFYINGTQSNYYSATLPTDIDTNTLKIGTADNFGAQSLSNVQIYNTSFSAAEVKALYIEGIGGAPLALQKLTRWWPLDGDANDYSGDADNGAATNGVNFNGQWIGGYTPP